MSKIDASEYEFTVSAAGRVNIIGEHVDYCGGKVLPAALSLKNTVYVRKNGTDRINLSWTTLPDKVSLDINRLDGYRGIKYGNYQAGSLLMWKNAGHRLVGCDMVMDCTVPFGSGLSSSAAIEVSTIAAMATAAGEKISPVDVALCAQKAEKEFAGVNCGIMDQYASACGRKNNAMLLDCKTLDCRYVPIELGDYELVIINSKKPHNLIESKYNERRAETELALSVLQKYTGASCLADVTTDELERYGKHLPETVRRRARHVVTECARVSAAVRALGRGDMAELGSLLDASHASMRDDFEITGFELDALAQAAREHEACVGSRMTGGGFGGCTVSIVERGGVADFKKSVCEKYLAATGYTAECYETEISDGIIIE